MARRNQDNPFLLCYISWVLFPVDTERALIALTNLGVFAYLAPYSTKDAGHTECSRRLSSLIVCPAIERAFPLKKSKN